MGMQREILREEELSHLCAAPGGGFGLKEQDEAVLLVKGLLRRQGFEPDVRCTACRLSVALSGMPSDPGSGGIMDLLSSMMAIGHTFEDVYNVGNDFPLSIDFWEKGHMATTVGKATGFSRRMKAGAVTPGEFWGAFDFRIGGKSATGRQ